MAGFCKYCGEISSRCGCASNRGSSVESKTVQALRASGSGMLAKDRWSSRYTFQRRSPPVPAATLPTQPSLPAPSRQTKPFFSSCPGSPPPSTEAEMEAFLSHSFGSVLDPATERAKWSCIACDVPFPRDSTVYPSETPNSYYCKACYASRKSKGTCVTCSRPVLGDVPFISRQKQFWHSSCANCTYCGNDVSHAPTVDLSGHLCCDNCFSSLAWRNSTPSSNVPSPSTSPVKPSPYSPNALRPKGQQKTTNPAIEALKQNYTSVGLEKPRPSPTPSSRPQSSPTTPRSPLPETPQQDLTSLCRKPLSSKESPKTPSRSGSDKEVQHIEGHCISCKENLYSVASHGVKVIKIHDGSTYHSSCFKCFVCRKTFDGGLQYAVEDGKPVHVECAPDPEPVVAPTARWTPDHATQPWSPPKPASSSLPRSKPLPSPEKPAAFHRPRPVRPASADMLPVLSKLGKGPSCDRCLKPITFLDRKVNAGGLNWHEPCCTCVSCGVQLVSPRVINGAPKCVACRSS